jgi:hypothetical protein
LDWRSVFGGCESHGASTRAATSRPLDPAIFVELVGNALRLEMLNEVRLGRWHDPVPIAATAAVADHDPAPLRHGLSRVDARPKLEKLQAQEMASQSSPPLPEEMVHKARRCDSASRTRDYTPAARKTNPRVRWTRSRRPGKRAGSKKDPLDASAGTAIIGGCERSNNQPDDLSAVGNIGRAVCTWRGCRWAEVNAGGTGKFLAGIFLGGRGDWGGSAQMAQ